MKAIAGNSSIEEGEMLKINESGRKTFFKANLLAVSKACRGEGHFLKQISWQQAKHAGVKDIF